MRNLFEVIKKMFTKGGDGNEIKKDIWKKLNILIAVAGAGILIILLSNSFTTGSNTVNNAGNLNDKENHHSSQIDPDTRDIAYLETELAKKLESILSEINGVGNIKVTVNLASSTQKDYAININTNNKTTEEKDQRGGNRTITETNENGQMVLVREAQGNSEKPVVVKEIKPEVKGVIVVSEGAEDPRVKSDLMNAVQVYLDVPLYKVVVLPKESR